MSVYKQHCFVGLLFLVLLLFQEPFRAQTQDKVEVRGKVMRADRNEVVPFCAIGIASKPTGCLSNEDGNFVIRPLANDTLVFSAIGYKKARLSVQSLLADGRVFLEESDKMLNEVTVYAENDMAYRLLQKSRKALMGSLERNAKAYFLLSTEIQNQAVELLECYYSAKLNNNRVKQLEFKNGRVGLAPYQNRYFVSLDISGAFTLLNLLFEDQRMPENPYQLSLKQCKRHYVVKLEERYDSLSPVQIVSFTAKDSANGFSGKAHLLRTNGLPLKIELFIHQTTHHPFRPLFPNAQIQHADMRLSKVFEYRGDSLYTHHIDFDYTLNYLIESENRRVKSKGLMYFYDTHQPFYPILYPFNSELNDYKKISSLSFNESFWKENQVLEYSDRTRSQRDYLEQHGLTINYNQTLNIKLDESRPVPFFESNDILWKADQRLSVIEDKLLNNTGKYVSDESSFRVNQYNFKANIYLDVNRAGDSLQHYSVSVFDVQQSFYNLKTNIYTDCFLNIYFDLVEMERRKMEKEISRKPHSWPHILNCYNTAKKNIEETGLRYFNEVKRGEGRVKLEAWNQKVLDELGINNMILFNIL